MEKKFEEILNWRYATKRMNGKKVPEIKLNRILKAIQMAPSSRGFQPYKILVISNEILKNKIYQQACTQAQVLECSHLLVFCVPTQINELDVENYLKLVVDARNPSKATMDRFRTMGKNVMNYTREELIQWSAKQAYLALGFGLTAAAINKVDATPMEGFKSDIMDSVLELESQNLHSVVLMALGFRDIEIDSLASEPKYRKPFEDLFIQLK